MSAPLHAVPRRNVAFWQERLDLAAAFRWAARLDLHEAVSNHFSLVVEEEGPASSSTRTRCISRAFAPRSCCCSMPATPSPLPVHAPPT